MASISQSRPALLGARRASPTRPALVHEGPHATEIAPDGDAAQRRLRARIAWFPRAARLVLGATAATAIGAGLLRPTAAGAALAIWSAVALLRVPRRGLLVEQSLVVGGALALAGGLVAGLVGGALALALAWLVALRLRPEVATQRLIGFDL